MGAGIAKLDNTTKAHKKKPADCRQMEISETDGYIQGSPKTQPKVMRTPQADRTNSAAVIQLERETESTQR
jgi:hypothetical protein